MSVRWKKLSLATKTTIDAIKKVPHGFYVLYEESKISASVVSMKWSASALITRHEKNLLRSNVDSLKKISVFFALQAVPIIGTIPILVALKYPRHILTHHFWTNEQKVIFHMDESMERHQYSHVLSALTAEEKDLGIQPLEFVSRNHLELLSGAIGITSHKIVLKLAPAFMLRSWLRKRAKEIAEDDYDIYKDYLLKGKPVLDGECPESLLDACKRRGFNYSRSLLRYEILTKFETNETMEDFKNRMRADLEQWVKKSVRMSADNHAELLYAIALNGSSIA